MVDKVLTCVLTCGHSVETLEEAIPLEYKFIDEGVISILVCKDCVKWYKKNFKAKVIK